jgi:hypothetical protein
MLATAAVVWYDDGREAGRRSSSGEPVADEPNPRTIGWTEGAVSPSKMVAVARRRFGYPERSWLRSEYEFLVRLGCLTAAT